jgi:hypothetical protein
MVVCFDKFHRVAGRFDRRFRTRRVRTRHSSVFMARNDPTLCERGLARPQGLPVSTLNKKIFIKDVLFYDLMFDRPSLMQG